MLVRDVMTKNVITVSSNTSLGDAKKVMKENNISRLPVLENGKLIGIVNEDRLESVSASRAMAPVPWQVFYLLSKTTVKDVMVKDVVTVSPDATAEESVALAQRRGVGALVVVEDGKVVGIVTTTDLFNGIVNRVLGIGRPGTRLIIPKAGEGDDVEKILNVINQQGIEVITMFTISLPRSRRKEFIIHLGASDVSAVVQKLKELGYQPQVRSR
ncbi:MAG: CBS domain-containing protein [Chloroflexota bacterium]